MASIDFRLLAVPVAMVPRPKDKKPAIVSTSVARLGETIPIRVVALRQDQLNAPIQLRVANLPAGLQCPEVLIPSGETEALLLLSVATNAPAWTGPIDIVGKATHGETTLERQARFGVVTWTVQEPVNEPVQARLTADWLFAVNTNEVAPVDFRAGESVETSVAGKVQIPLQVTRHGDFNETLKIKPYGFKALEKAKEQDLEAKAEQAKYELDLTQIKLEPGPLKQRPKTPRNNWKNPSASPKKRRRKPKQLDKPPKKPKPARANCKRQLRARRKKLNRPRPP
jgi:hypothetical protein